MLYNEMLYVYAILKLATNYYKQTIKHHDYDLYHELDKQTGIKYYTYTHRRLFVLNHTWSTYLAKSSKLTGLTIVRPRDRRYSSKAPLVMNSNTTYIGSFVLLRGIITPSSLMRFLWLSALQDEKL